MEHITLKTDVLIVGAGPVGLVLANILTRNKIKVILIDKREVAVNLPRAIAVNQSTLDIFATLGLQRIFDDGLVVEHTNLYGNQKFLGQLNFKDTTLDHPYFFHITQNEVEKVLEEALQKFSLNIIRGAELIDYTQDDSSVLAQVTKDGKIFFIDSQFLIGSDGGKSSVRKIMGCGVTQREYGHSFVLADVLLKDYKDQDTRYIFTRKGYLMIVPLPEKKYRLIFSLHDAVQLKPEEHFSYQKFLQQLLNERSGNLIEILAVLWATQSSYGHKISNQILQSRVVLAGDALHQFSPVGGTNMNVGIQDAFALGWRLIHALKKTPLFLSYLSGYEMERQMVIQKQQILTEWITALVTRSKNHPSLAYLNPIKNQQKLKSYLTGLGGADNKPHLQSLINYQEISGLVGEIREVFSKANYLLLTRGKLTAKSLEKIEKSVRKKLFLTWIHKSEKELGNFFFCRPDALVIGFGDLHSIQQLKEVIDLIDQELFFQQEDVQYTLPNMSSASYREERFKLSGEVNCYVTS